MTGIRKPNFPNKLQDFTIAHGLPTPRIGLLESFAQGLRQH